jgi:hypothetical protein
MVRVFTVNDPSDHISVSFPYILSSSKKLKPSKTADGTLLTAISVMAVFTNAGWRITHSILCFAFFPAAILLTCGFNTVSGNKLS